MATLSTSTERTSESLTTVEQNEAPSIVFQPQKLREVMDVINLMGSISDRVREESSQDMGGGSSAGGTAGRTTTISAREQMLANLPEPTVMQIRLTKHIEGEMKKLEVQARKFKHARTPGAAYTLSELFKRIRRFSALIDEIVHATGEIIKRFFVAVFIDKRPLDVK